MPSLRPYGMISGCSADSSPSPSGLGAKPESVEDVCALTHLVHRGDAAAFSRFYDAYSFRVYKYLLVLAHGNEADAREVCQSVFIKVAKRLPAFETEGQLWAWLCTLARNGFIDYYRAHRRHSRLVPLEELPESTEAPVCELSDSLQAALERLLPEESELIQAVYVDGRPIQDLADAMGQSYKAIESRLGRLRQKLKQELLKNLRHENQS